MVDSGGIGSFAGGFAKSFAASREQRRLRDLDLMRQQQGAAREQRMQQQFRETQDFRVEQQKTLETYRAGQQQLQEKQVEIQKKSLDLNIMSGLEKVFDPKISKPQRQFILKQTMKTLEIDPKSTEGKDFMQMATSMDDDALKEVRSSLMTMIPDATPGQVTAFAHSIISGRLEMKDALKQFDEAKKAKKLEDINSGAGAPTQRVQSSRVTDPTPMAQQQPGGDLPIPGMAQPSGEPTAGGATPQQLRDRASELFKNGFTTEGSAQLQLARDLEAGKDVQLVQVVGKDGKQIYVKDTEAEGMEAPSTRPVKTPEEERLTKSATESATQDYARVKPWLEDASTAKATAPVIQAFKTANKSGKFVSGSFSNVRENITKVAELLGISSDDIKGITSIDIGDPAIAETLKSTSAQLGTLMAERLGRATNMQVGYIQDALPNLMKTPRGNEIAVDLLERSNERAIAIERLYDKYQDAYGGDLRPKGKPSFFAEADRIRREPLVNAELEKEIKSEAKKGEAVDLKGLWDKAQGAADEVLKIGEQKFGVSGKFELHDDKGKVTGSFPMIKLKDGNDYPYVTTPEEGQKLPHGTKAVRLDPLKGPVMWTRE